MKNSIWPVLALALALSPMPSSAQTTRTLEVIVFPGGFNWPIWAAQDKGYFAGTGVEVHLTPTPGSVFQLTNLIDGKFDIGITAIDNAIAYDEGQGEAPTAGKADLVAVMGCDNGFLHLVTLPEIRSVQELRGKTLSVDARTTGYAFVLEKMLEIGGLGESDYTLVKAGGVLERFQALMKKQHAGTLLLSPFEISAEAQGFHDLGAAIDVFGHYQGLVAAVQRPWAKAHPGEVVGFIRGYLQGVDWLYDPAHKPEAIALLRKNLTSMTPELAEKTYGVLLDRRTGFFRNGKLDLEGIKTVLALRSQYGEPKKKLGDPARYYDLSYYEKAMRR